MGITHLSGLEVAGVPIITSGGAPLFTGTWFWVDPANGNDDNDGLSPDSPYATLYQAHASMTAGKNDVCVLVGDGSTTGTARLSTALAATINSAATTGTLTWSKNACHLIGMTAPTMVAQRARIAPPSGTYTQSTFGSGNFIVVSGAGCYFANFSTFNGFSTGGTNQICLTVTGSRNYFWNVQLGGMGDAASAQDTGSRNLKIGSGGSGENTFDQCVIGLDTVTRTVANASIEFAGATPRNVFRNCIFPFMTSSADVLGILTSGSGAMDRWQLFDNCMFINNIGSTSTQMTALCTLAASSGGILISQNSTMVGITDWGTDATAEGQIYIMGPAPVQNTTGIAIEPV